MLPHRSSLPAQAEQLNRRIKKDKLKFSFMDGRHAIPYFQILHDRFMRALCVKIGAAAPAAGAVPVIPESESSGSEDTGED